MNSSRFLRKPLGSAERTAGAGTWPPCSPSSNGGSGASPITRWQCESPEVEEAATDDAACGRTSAPVIRLPLDRAAHRRHKGRGRLLAGQDRVEDLAHHLRLHVLRFLRVVELPAVPQFPGGVEHEEVRRAHRTVRLRDLLAFVT